MAKITQKCGDFYYTVDTNETTATHYPWFKGILLVLLYPLLLVLGFAIVAFICSLIA